MKNYVFPKKVIAIFTIIFMLFSFASCGEPTDFNDDDENMMPEFNYIIFPLLTQAEDVYKKVFSSVEYSNRSFTAESGTIYYFVEPSEYEVESFETSLRGTFTSEYADEYIEMMFGGDNPLYVEHEGYLYVNPDKLIDYEFNQYNTETCIVRNYNGIYATISVNLIDGTLVDYDVECIDGIWYLGANIGQVLNKL
ncbi:MAG: hypothetical protein IKU25_06260 [Clostridia bacterium]|nr:hypothetical protein [Clostridia bacterium]